MPETEKLLEAFELLYWSEKNSLTPSVFFLFKAAWGLSSPNDKVLRQTVCDCNASFVEKFPQYFPQGLDHLVADVPPCFADDDQVDPAERLGFWKRELKVMVNRKYSVTAGRFDGL